MQFSWKVFIRLFAGVIVVIVLMGNLEAPPAHATSEIPALTKIPPPLAAQAPLLVAERQQLVVELDVLDKQFAVQTAQCAAVPQSDTARVKHCKAEAYKLNKLLVIHIKERNDFNAQIAGQVTQEMFSAARRNCSHANELRSLFLSKLSQLDTWREDSEEYRRESEALRADAVRGVFSDVLDAFPIDEFSDKFIATPKSRAYLKFFYGMTQAALSVTSGISEPDQVSKFKAIASSEPEVRTAVLELVRDIGEKGKESELQRKWIENTGRVFSSSVLLLSYSIKERKGEANDIWIDRGELVVEMLELWSPVGKMVHAGFNLGYRGASFYTATRSIEEIHDVLNNNWRAKYHLKSKVAELDDSLREAKSTMDIYRSRHPNVPSCKVSKSAQ